MIDVLGFPQTVYHPVYGAVTLTDVDHAVASMSVPSDWFPTPQVADAHRTEADAQMILQRGNDDSIVVHSVTHQDAVDRRMEAAAIEAEAASTPPPPPEPDKPADAELKT